MKKLLFLAVVLFNTTLQAKNYYVSSTGSNSNDGLSPSTPWQTIDKVNASFGSFAAGDSILFKCGESFYGSIVASKSGTSTSPIVISSYGTGAKPVISGFTTLTGWTNVSGNIWQSTPGAKLKKDVNVLTINGVPQAVGRTNWMTYQSATSTTLTSSSLTGTPSYVGAEIVSKKNTFVAEKATITAQSGSTVTYANNTQPINNGSMAGLQSGKSGNGFFLQRFAGSLDQQGEWFYNSSTNKMQLYSTTNPSSFTVKASYVDTIINLNTRTNISVSNLAVEGGGIYGIESYTGSSSITVRNCSFNNNTKAIYMWNTNDATVDGNTINNSFNNAILVSNNQAKRINITNNKITNTGQLIGMGVFNNEYSLRGIVARTSADGSSNYVNIIGNSVINTGNGAIQFQGSNVLVRRNVTDTFCNQLDDNGGIYTFSNNQTVNSIIFTNRLVDSNFISNAIGAPLGSANNAIDVAGLYMDDQSMNVVARYNTIMNIPGNGIQLNNSDGLTVTDNTIYNCTYAIAVNKKTFSEMRNIVVKRNVIYQKDSSQILIFHTNANLTLPTSMTITQSLTSMATIDSNWISNMKNQSFGYYYSSNGGAYTFPPGVVLSQWKSTYSHSQHCVLPLVKATPTNTKIEINATGTSKTISFSGESYIDAKGTVYNNTATIRPWSSLVLLKNGSVTVTNNKPSANAGNNVTITLPVNSTTLTGSATDNDGTISSYAWLKIAGPSAGTVASSNTSTTNVNNLEQGVYQFQLTATDDKGAVGRDTVQVTVNAAPNVAPTVNAGSNIAITLPTNSTTLTGSGTDKDGTISNYAWLKIAGPSAGTIATSNTATTNVTNLVQGVYQFQLTATDDKGAAGRDTVQVTVNAAPNIAPTVNAGSNIAITLPTNSTTLTGSGTDKDGTISSYAWLKITGPSAGTIATSNTATTNVTNLVQGVYQFQLTATDDKGAVGRDTVQVTVNAAPNVAPAVNAGSNIAITLPTNSTTLTGSGTDKDGTISSYAWLKIAGPSAGTIVTSNTATTNVSNLVQGVYQFQLTVTDDKGAVGRDTVQVTVNAAANVAPTVNAGNNIAITLPTNSTTLTGSGADKDGTISSYAWLKIAGPSAGTIASSSTATTNINNLVQGVYQFQLTATDDKGAVGRDTVQVTVNAAPNVAPTVNAGSNIAITLPTNSATLTGSGTDKDGTISSYAWLKIAGPSAGTIVTSNTATTNISNLVQGVYQFQLTAIDDKGAVGRDTVQVTVNAAPNVAPSVDAGADKVIKLPVTSTTLNGTSSDADGTITVLWTKVSGGAVTITTPTNDTTTITGLVAAGVYEFDLTVTDNLGAVAVNRVQVTVTPANETPVAYAGVDTSITLPVSSATLTGSGKDSDGTIAIYEWTKIAGPVSGTIATPDASTTVVSGLTEGVYKYKLRTIDNEGAIGRDTVQVTVNAAPNVAPLVNAGSNIAITLPTDSTTLKGSGTDKDGTITSYTWSRIAGPSTGTIVSSNGSIAKIDNLVQGVYRYQLTATDNKGAVGRDTVQVTVNAAPIPAPSANAGADITITTPTNRATLTGSGIAAAGSIGSYAWSKISGPSSSKIGLPDSASTSVFKLVTGVYQFELSVTDTNGATGKDTVQVIVANPVRQGPTFGDWNHKDTAQVMAKPADKEKQLSTINADNENKKEFNVYPNPVTDVANLNFNTTNNKLTVSVTDMSGRMVKYNELVNLNKTKSVKLDMTGISNGYYVITVRFEDGQRFSAKVIKNGNN